MARDELAAELDSARAALSDGGAGPVGYSADCPGLLRVWDSAVRHEIASFAETLLRVLVRRGHQPLVVGPWTAQVPS